DVVAHARQVLDAAAADHHHRVLLQVVPLARDIADHLEAVGQAHLRHLAQRGVRLLRRRRIDAGADAALLRRVLQRRDAVAAGERRPRLADQLVDGWHPPSSPRWAGARSTGLAPGSKSPRADNRAQSGIAPSAPSGRAIPWIE